jgi:Tfp pilus assembly protein PilX
MNRSIEKDERGWILIVSMAMTIVITFMGMLVLQSASVDARLAGAERNSETARYIAEAGIAWAVEKLNTEPGLISGSNLRINTLLGYSTYESMGDDSLCTASLITENVNCYPNELAQWGRLHPEQTSIAYNGGHFRVGVRDDNDDNNFLEDSNDQFFIRAYGVSIRGARSVVEVLVSQSAESNF